jgi:hypothetical protein
VKSDDPLINFKKICIEGSGKGRMELAGSKNVFEYESQLNKKNNHFDLAFSFPIVGEKKISLSLNPKETAQEINRSELLKAIESQIGERYNKQQILNALEEFFVLTSEFLYYRSKDKLPTSYTAHFENDHFFIQRPHDQFRFEVESFDEEQDFFRRVIIKIFPLKADLSLPLFTLFLVPETCDHK